MLTRTLALIAVLLALAPRAAAHDVEFTPVTVTLAADGRYTIDVVYDLDALLLGTRPEHLTPAEYRAIRDLPAEEFARQKAGLVALLDKRISVRFDGQEVRPAIEFPRLAQPPSEAAAEGPVLGDTTRLSGAIPAGAAHFTIWFSRSFGRVPLAIRHHANAESRELLGTATESTPYPLAAAAPAPSRTRVFRDYLLTGFEHILPKGLDHILFVLGLYLLSNQLRSLLWQVTAFTLAHSITLALSMYGVVRLPASVVEPLIALSIAYVAIENIATTRLHFWRPLVVFAFGLLHGLGFAGVLTEVGLPRGEFATALVAFNVGVELGQVAVILLALLVVGWCRQLQWYRARIVIPASGAIAACGLFWTVQRALGS